MENRLTGVTGAATFVYDGLGFRVKKTEGGQTILYVNQYYEKNLSSGVVTLYYYLGGKLVAKKTDTTLDYIHQDHLGSTALLTKADGTQDGTTMKYFPFGAARSGSVPTDKLFTGQSLDATGLYYYGARYYDASLGRFISADTIVPRPANPQSLNRYTYTLNNPLRYVDPSGHEPSGLYEWAFILNLKTDEILNRDWDDRNNVISDVVPRVWSAYYSGEVVRPPSPPPSAPSLPATPSPAAQGTAAATASGTLPVSGNTQAAPPNTGTLSVQVDISGALVVSVPENSFVAKQMRGLQTGSPEGAGAVTLDPFIFVRSQIYRAQELPDVIAHERVHIIQQRAMGLGPFLVAYEVGKAIFGYARNPFEWIAQKIGGYP